MNEFLLAISTIYLAAAATYLMLSVPHIIEECRSRRIDSILGFILFTCIIYIISPIAIAIILTENIINEEF